MFFKYLCEIEFNLWSVWKVDFKREGERNELFFFFTYKIILEMNEVLLSYFMLSYFMIIYYDTLLNGIDHDHACDKVSKRLYLYIDDL